MAGGIATVQVAPADEPRPQVRFGERSVLVTASPGGWHALVTAALESSATPAEAIDGSPAFIWRAGFLPAATAAPVAPQQARVPALPAWLGRSASLARAGVTIRPSALPDTPASFDARAGLRARIEGTVCREDQHDEVFVLHRFFDAHNDGLRALAEHVYDPTENHFVPMWADGTVLTGKSVPRFGYYCSEDCNPETVWTPLEADMEFLMTYARAYRLTGDDLFWQTARQMAQGLGLGEIGIRPGDGP